MKIGSFEKKNFFDDSYFKQIKKLKKELEAVWLKLKKEHMAVVVILEGPNFCGKDTVMSEMVSLIDPRFFQTYLIKKPNQIERKMPLMWRFWNKIPQKGMISFFDGSWYNDLFFKNFKKFKLFPNLLENNFEIVKNFENFLIADRTLIVKLYFKISFERQKFLIYDELKKKFSFCNINLKKNLYFDFEFDSYVNFILDRTNFIGSNWHVVYDESDCCKTLKSLQIFLKSLKYALTDFCYERELVHKKFLNLNFEICKPVVKHIFNEKKVLKKSFYKSNLKKLQFKLAFFQKVLFCKKIPLILLFEGTDAAGKGGAIKRIVRSLDARFYRVVPIFKPTELELTHHYFWRFVKNLPARGHIVIFDRSWYGRVLVERVDRLTPKFDLKRAYGEINCFEKDLVGSGVILLKFWLQISKQEQLERFKKRKKNPNKAWKLTVDDWKNREKWDDYNEAVEEMFSKTSTKLVPWRLVDSNLKKFARLQILNEIILEIQRILKF